MGHNLNLNNMRHTHSFFGTVLSQAQFKENINGIIYIFKLIMREINAFVTILSQLKVSGRRS